MSLRLFAVLVCFLVAVSFGSAYNIKNPYRHTTGGKESHSRRPPVMPSEVGLNEHIPEEELDEYVESAEQEWRSKLQPGKCDGPSCPPRRPRQPWVKPTLDDSF
eukprot:6181503-Pleurochrysis_carterae.AAC.1